jgi:hypothetical protein
LLAGLGALVVGATAADAPVSILSVFRPQGPAGFSAEVYPKLAHVFVSSTARRLFTVSNGPGWLAAYDLDTITPVGTGHDPLGTVTGVFVDPSAPVVYAGVVQNNQQVVLREYASRPTGVVLLGSLDLTSSLVGRQIIGMYRLPRSDVAWLLSSGLQGGVVISEVSLAGMESGKATHRWTAPQPQCTVAMHSQAWVPAGLGFAPDSTGGSLYFGCGSPSVGLTGPPVPRGAARLRLEGDPARGPTTPGRFDVFPKAGDFSQAVSLYDPGSNRLVMSAYSSVTQGSTVYVFDGSTNTYVGGITAGSTKLDDSGMDPVSGRLYAASGDANTGLILADVRPTPASQGATVPSFAKRPGGQPDIGSNIAVDPPTRRIFIKYTTGEVVVAQDNVPRYATQPPGDPDGNTVDVPEAPGKTSADYAAAVQGFGTRVRQIGGIGALAVNYVGIDTRTVGVGAGTREYRGAYLNSMWMTNDEASASVITADIDEANSQADLRASRTTPPPPPDAIPEQPRQPVSNAENEVDSALHDSAPIPAQVAAWPYFDAVCHDFGGSAGTGVQPDASTECDAAGHTASARALEKRTAFSSFVVSDGRVDAGARLDRSKGVVAAVTATSRGFSIPNVLSVGEVSVTSTAWAKGRPATARAQFERRLRHVSLQDKELCADRCDPVAVAQRVNQELGAFLRVEFPEPDRAFLGGSRGGYQAMVRRVPAAHLEDVLVNEQPEDRQEVPGMVVTMIQDGFRPSRTVIELAGTAVEVHYGIAALDDAGGPDHGDPGVPAVLELGATAGSGPLFGLGPHATAGGPLGQSRRVDGSLPVLRAVRRLLWNGLAGARRLLPVWGVLLAPIYLSSRRWLLLQRSRLRTG